MNRGKILILLMIAAGISAGTLKIWRQHRHMDQVLAKLSPGVVQLIAEAPMAELLRLQLVSKFEGSVDHANCLKIEGRNYQIVDRKNTIGAKGFADVRDRLVDDASYDWNGTFEAGSTDWQYVLQFVDGQQQVRLAFNFAGDQYSVMKVIDDGPILCAHPIADGLAPFFAAQFKDAPAGGSTRK